jgi:superfamily II DNA or RNA helicase
MTDDNPGPSQNNTPGKYEKAISNKGYVIRKEILTSNIIKETKRDLTVTPFVSPDYSNSPPPSFRTYLESPNKLFLPVHYGIAKFGLPSLIKIESGRDINLTFNGKLRPEQILPIKKFMEATKDPYKRGGILCLPCGFGKCLARNTPVMMYDGTIKNVQDITIYDRIMGDDSKPRNILSISKGKDKMYKVIQKNKGSISYMVNSSHILSLKCIRTNDMYTKNIFYDISIEQYNQLPKYIRESLHGYKVEIEFPNKKITIDPYSLGINISCYIYIPPNYKYNSMSVRLELLAGFIDGNAVFVRKGYEINDLGGKMANDIIYIVRSVGFVCHYMLNNKFKYTLLIVPNNSRDLPLKIQKKRVWNNKDTLLTTSISIKPMHYDTYYGFQIDGNRRFLLGDFTVTHNTTIAIHILCELAKKTLIVVHKDFLLQQWEDRINQFAPGAKIGKIKAKIIDVEDKDIVIASLQSISMKQYDPNVFDGFALCVIDECLPYKQHISTEKGPMYIGQLYDLWEKKADLPMILSYNEISGEKEYKRITYAWKKINPDLFKISYDKSNIKCTPNHRILTNSGYKPASSLKIGDLLKSIYDESGWVSIRDIKTIKNESYCDYVYDLEVSDNHNFICCSNDTDCGIIVHNCHHTGAEVFSQALKKVNFRWSLGLSATPTRKDGLTKVFTWHLGNILYNITKRSDNASVRRITYHNNDPQYNTVCYNYLNKLNIAKMINNICDFLPRTIEIVDIIVNLLETDSLRKILVLSDRRSHLECMNDLLDKKAIDNGLYMGGIKQNILKHVEKCDVILGTFSIASEGLDVSGLNTLILASPKSDIIQASGRILRDTPDKRLCTPLIIDICDKFSVFERQSNKRLVYYKKCKYVIEGKADDKEKPDIEEMDLQKCMIKD